MLFLMLLAVGGLARDSGYPLGVAVLSTILIWAAPGQVVFFAALAAGASLPAAALAIGVSSIRLLPMSVSLLPILRGAHTPLWRQILLSHFIAITAWVEGMRRLPHVAPPERQPFFLAFALTIMASAILGTMLGYVAVGRLPPLFGAAIVFVAPLYFTISLLASATGRADHVAVLAGFVLTPPVVALVPEGIDLLVIGLGGGSLGYWVRRRGKRPS